MAEILLLYMDVFVPLSQVTHPNIKQIDCIFSYIMMHIEEQES